VKIATTGAAQPHDVEQDLIAFGEVFGPFPAALIE
jgi:hypothetical protein